MQLMIWPIWRDPLSERLLLLYGSHAVCLLSPPWPPHTSSNNGNLLQVFFFFFLLTWRDKQPDESGVMHGLTGTDSTQPTVNICRQDRISALAARRCIYLPLARLVTALSLNYHVWEVQIIHANGTTPNHYQHKYTVCFPPCLSELHFIEQRL